ncbi:MFS transporter [Halovenus marina]|uniref:MFS transporter n=1 Tax=Halovenus marina TaxID=3396621 RepID=UPI003F567000
MRCEHFDAFAASRISGCLWGEYAPVLSEQRGFKLFYFVMFASFSGYAMFRNVFFEEIGLSGTEMGIIGFMFPLFTMLAQPVWGLVADWKGISKLILFISAIGAGLAALIYPFAPAAPSTLVVVLVATVLFAVFRAPAMPIANALVLTTGLSYEGVRAYGSIAFGVAGLGFGYLVGVFQTELVFFAYTIGMAAVVALLFVIPVDEPDALGSDLSVETVRPLLTKQYTLVLVAAFALGVMTPATGAFFSVYIRAVGHADWITGVAWLVKTVAEAVAFLYIARRGGSYRRLMAIAGVLYTVTYLVLFLSGSAPPIVLAQVLLGAGYALFNLASVNLAHGIAPEGLKSTAQSFLFVGGMSSGRAVGELVVGRLFDVVGAQETFGVLAALGIVTAVISLLIATDLQTPEAAADPEA